MNPFYIGLPAYIGGLILASILNERLLGKLSAEQIGGTTLAQRPLRIRIMVVSAASVAAMLALQLFVPQFGPKLFLALLAGFTAAYAYAQIALFRIAAAVIPKQHQGLLSAVSAVNVAAHASLTVAMAATAL